MKKRKSSFVGSEEWRKRDTTYSLWMDGVRVTDTPTGVSVTYRGDGDRLERAFTDLAHRVKQLAS